MITIFIILAAVAAYLLGAWAWIYFWGWKAGRSGEKDYATRRADYLADPYDHRKPDMTGNEILAAWAVAWPIIVVGFTIFVGPYFAVTRGYDLLYDTYSVANRQARAALDKRNATPVKLKEHAL